MQSVSAALLSVLRTGINADAGAPLYDFSDGVEFYASDYIPDAGGFDPTDAVETFAAIDLTWNGVAYRRSVVSRGEISKHMGQQTNSVTVSFSNIDRYVSDWAQTTQIEGLWMVIRCVSRAVTDSSIVLFVGRSGKPSTINNRSFSLSASTDIGNLNQEIPPRSFTAEDPEGRDPSDPLYEGIPFVQLNGTFNYTSIVPAHHGLARLFGQRDTDLLTKQYSSLDNTPYGNPIPEVLGRCQMELDPFISADKGVFVSALWAVCNGPIAAVENIKTHAEGLSDPINSFGSPPVPAIVHLGDAGGTGTNQGNTGQADLGGGNVFSHLAYVEGAIVPTQVLTDPTFSDPEILNELPVVTALVKGRVADLPDGSGVYNQTGWTDNPVHLTRWVFTYLMGIPSGLMGDAVSYLTSLKCDTPLLDESNSERVFIPSADVPQAGTGIIRYRSSGVIDSRYIRGVLLSDPGFGNGEENDPTLVQPVYESWNPNGVIGDFGILRFYRKRYTFNAPITQRVKALDFLYKTLYPSFRGYHTINAQGKIEIKTEEKADNAFLRSASIVGATSILVDDAIPWKTSLYGKLLIGYGLTTSEVRIVTSALYTADGNGITLTAAGTAITATASGATLSGGSTTVQASGTVTFSGTLSGTVTITINGIAVVYILDAFDTLASVAAMMAQIINADSRLGRFIAATYSGAVLTIRAKWGVLNFSALAFAHTGPKAVPTIAPTLAQSAGTLAAGDYQVAYSDVNAVGETTISPISTITLLASRKIDIAALSLPAGITSRNWYMSESPNSDKLLYAVSGTGAAFSLTALPSKDNTGIPPYNSTAEESLRIALSFSSNSQGATILAQSGLTRANVITDSYNFPLGSEQSSVNQIKGSFRDAKNDFALTPFTINDRVHQAAIGGKINTLEVDFSGVDNWPQAYRLGSNLLSKFREGDWFNSLQTQTGEALLLEEGDLISASDDAGGHVNVTTRLESFSISPTWQVKVNRARRYSTLMHSDDVRQHSIPLPAVSRYLQTVDTQFIPMDLPFWRDTDPIDEPGFHVAFCRSLDDGDWRGTRIYADASGAYVPLTEKLQQNVPLGVATTVLTATTNVYTIDSLSTVRVQITAPGGEDGTTYQLASTTEEKMFAGANKFALGINGRWELGNFQTATLVGGTTDTYDLTVFLRGRHGTEENTSNHVDTDSFVLLTDADGNDTGVQFVPIDFRLLNALINLKAVTTNQDVADATAVPFTWEGRILMLWATINHRASRDSANSVLFECEFRSSVGGGLRSYQAGASHEESEEGRIQILNAGSTTLPNGKERILPLIVGMPQAALLESDASSGKFGYVAGNSLNLPAGAGINVNAASFQTIEKTGNFVDAKMEVIAFNGERACFGIVPASFIWRGKTLAQIQTAAHIWIQYEASIPDSVMVREYDVLKYSELSPGNSRYRIAFSGTEIRVYRNWTGSSGEMVYSSPKEMTFPYRVIARVETDEASVSNITLTTSPFPKTIYSIAQQNEDFSNVLQTSTQADWWQESKTSGPGVKTRITL